MNRPTQSRSKIGSLFALALPVALAACGAQASDAAISQTVRATLDHGRRRDLLRLRSCAARRHRQEHRGARHQGRRSPPAHGSGRRGLEALPGTPERTSVSCSLLLGECVQSGGFVRSS